MIIGDKHEKNEMNKKKQVMMMTTENKKSNKKRESPTSWLVRKKLWLCTIWRANMSLLFVCWFSNRLKRSINFNQSNGCVHACVWVCAFVGGQALQIYIKKIHPTHTWTYLAKMCWNPQRGVYGCQQQQPAKHMLGYPINLFDACH